MGTDKDSSGGRRGGSGVNTKNYFSLDMTSQVNKFDSVVNDQNLINAFRGYASGMYGGDEKEEFDNEYGISDFIDSDTSSPLHLRNNPTLYRGGTISDAELNNLKVGDTLDIMDSKDQLTSWTDREMVAHMYAEESSGVWGQGGSQPRNVVIVDTSKTSDAIVMPYSYPQNETLRSKRMEYKITKIVDEAQYKSPIGRKNEASNDYYLSPVTYIYVKSKKK